ncbi:bifunctional metallophosphatase/5'-nucleotidase [Vibrio owensii]|nr:bifunctional metallophosphatase/5'-nucleotidase [Vibrio owensii]
MTLFKRSLVCIAVVGLMAGCNDDETKYVEVPSDYSPVVAEGKTLTNTPDVVVKGEATQADEVTIAIAATSDLHGRLFGFDYALNAEDDDAGITRVATLLADQKAAHPNMILIDIGDTVQGNSAQLFNDDPTHPVVESMNSLGFDVWVPGNHEFNFERSFVDRNLDHFNGAVLSSNIKWESNDVNYIRAFQMFEVEGVKVAIVGLTPSNVPNWEASAPDHFKGLKFENELDATKEAVDQLVSKYNPDVIVGALHLGRQEDGGVGVYEIASAMADKFDVILAGHEHANYIEQVNADGTVTPISKSTSEIGGENTLIEDKAKSGEYNQDNRAQSVKIIEPGKWGAYLAKAEIQLKKVDGKWTMEDTTLTNIGTKKVEEDQALQAKFQYVDDISIEDATRELGRVTGNFTPSATGYPDEATATDYNYTAERLYSTIHLAKVVDTPLMDVINQIQMQKIEDAVGKGNGAVVSAASLFSDQSNLIDGEVYTKGKSTNLYKYDNTLLGVEMTGANLKRFIEWSYSYFNQYQPGDITVSFKKGAPAYLYDQFDGDIEFTVDLSKPSLELDENNTVTNEGSRVNITSIGGEQFDPNATYKVAMNSYRFGSQIQKFGWASKDDVFYDSVNEQVYAIRDMLTAYVEENKGINVADFSGSVGNWSFTQYLPSGDITTLREGEGKALWDQLKNMEICVSIDLENPKYPAIVKSVNINDSSSYFVNPNKDAATLDEKVAGCNPTH